jgi:hypothetical protein
MEIKTILTHNCRYELHVAFCITKASEFKQAMLEIPDDAVLMYVCGDLINGATVVFSKDLSNA